MSTKTHRDEVIRRLKRIETRLHLLCTRFEVNTEDQELGGQLVLDFGDDEYERIVLSLIHI